MKILKFCVILAITHKVSCDARKCKAIIYSRQTIQSIPKQTVILRCRCEFCDEEIFWIKNGSIFNATIVRHHSENNESQLTLNGSNEEIEGLYICSCGESSFDELIRLGESMVEGQGNKHLRSIAVVVVAGVLIVVFVLTMCFCCRRKWKICLKKHENRESKSASKLMLSRF